LQKNLSFSVVLPANATATDRRAGAFFAAKWSFFEAEQGQACLLLPTKYFVVV